jgi:hypothetical protein
MRVEDWDFTFAVLVRGVFLGIKHGARDQAPRRWRLDHQHRVGRGARAARAALLARPGRGREPVGAAASSSRRRSA